MSTNRSEPLPLASARGPRVLAVTVLGSAIVLLETTVINVSLPAIGRDLDADLAELQWVVSGYVSSVLPGVVVFGLGLASVVAPVTATVLAAAPERHAGIASGVSNAVARTRRCWRLRRCRSSRASRAPTTRIRRYLRRASKPPCSRWPRSQLREAFSRS